MSIPPDAAAWCGCLSASSAFLSGSRSSEDRLIFGAVNSPPLPALAAAGGIRAAACGDIKQSSGKHEMGPRETAFRKNPFGRAVLVSRDVAAGLISAGSSLISILAIDLKWLATEFHTFWCGKPQKKENGSPLKVLLIAASFPPTFNAGVYRPLSWARRAADRKVLFSVVTFEPPPDEKRHSEYLADRIPDSVHVTRISRSTAPVYWRLFPKFHSFLGNALAFFTAADEAMRETPADIVVATGPSFFTFPAAMWTSRKWRVPFVLDYRDEWSLSPNPDFAHLLLGRYFERRCAESANTVLFATQSFIDAFHDGFPSVDRHNLKLLPNGWDSADWIDIEKPNRLSDTRTIITFLGHLTLHTGGAGFIRAFEEVFYARSDLADRVLIKLVGWGSEEFNDHITQSPFAHCFEVHPPVEKQEAIAIMLGSDILLLPLDARYSRYFPGKAYEYIASGRPILLIGADGEVADVIRRLNAGVIIEGFDSKALENAIDQLMSKNPADWDTAARREWAQERERQRLADSFFNCLHELVAGRQRA